MAGQINSGKSFEYALLTQFEEKLKNKTNVEIVKNSQFTVAKKYFENNLEEKQGEYLLYASFAVNFLIDIEPRLSNDVGEKDILQLEILSDHYGKAGDVRDVLAIRLLQKWEIGVSAKNNHDAVKHSRLSNNIDFGDTWLGIKCSDNYFDEIGPIFENLEKIKLDSGSEKKWRDLSNRHETVYVPILKSFIKELKRIYENNDEVPSVLTRYLIGNKDFYKVIKSKSSVDIVAYNLSGTLNFPFKDIQPKYKTPQVPLPTKILNIDFKKDSKTTVIVEMDNEWIFSFRIHSAKTTVEPSLKFDVQLVNSPKKLFRNKLNISKD